MGYCCVVVGIVAVVVVAGVAVGIDRVCGSG